MAAEAARTARRLTLTGAGIAVALLVKGCAMDDEVGAGIGPPAAVAGATVTEPMADRRPWVIDQHGERRVDHYYWLRDDTRTDPDVIAYLEAENAYVDAAMAPLAALRETLYEELKSRIRPDDDSVPYRDGDWVYQTRYSPGTEHPVYVRWPAAGGDAQVILDVNRLSVVHDYYEVGELAVSEDGRLLAFSEDLTGREEFVVRVKDLEAGVMLDVAIAGTSGEIAWANDHRSLFYVRRQPETLIANRVFRHVLGQKPASDTLVYEELDPSFYLELGKSLDGRWIVIHAAQTLADEYRLVDADAPEAPPRLVIPRRRGHEHAVEPVGDRLFILTNLDAPDGRLVEAPLDDPADTGRWREMLGHRPGTPLEAFVAFDGHVVVNERVDGLLALRVIDRQDGRQHVIDVSSPAATTEIDINPSTAGTTLRYATSSMARPDTIAEYDLVTRRGTVLRAEEVPGGFDASDYVTEMISAPARDGQSVPVTLLYRREDRPAGPRPLVLVGYGAYGLSYDPQFNTDRFSLVDRGFAFGIAHVRGGLERGRRWYDEGRLLNKTRTFTDFVDVTEHLIAEGIADPERISAIGRSAGGLLMGAIANLRPDLYCAIVAGVPFVDVVTGMSDPDIPIVTFEYDEWGNPAEREHYEYMLAYSPYDQVSAQDYPPLLVTAGFHDPRVQYWEPAKWVARLRHRRTNEAPLYLKTNMEAGHFDASGRFESLRETALEYAFILDRTGAADRRR
jgi:oligopeptidase B